MKTPRNRRDDTEKPVSKLLFSLALVAGEIFLIRVMSRHLDGSLMAGFGTSLIMLGAIVAGAIILSILWTPQISELLFRPLTSLFDGGNTEPESKPHYSMATAKRKQGKFLEAVVEIRRQLARFPNDFEGVMLLAGVQAEDLKDLASAEITLNHFCDQPHPLPKQVAAAMNHLADWQLKLAQDTEAARAALEKIITRFPDTEPAQLAAQRIGHLGGMEKILLAAHDRQAMAVPEGVQNIGLLKASDHLRPAETDPEKLAVDYVKHLEQHPLDTEIREQLAILYADHYQRLDLATSELEQLIESPKQPTKRVAHWLNLLADLQVRHGAEYDTVRRTLEKIVKRFPDWAAAEMARARLNRLKLEFKGQAQRSTVKLGVYEQNLGLKHGRPRQL
jgi:TolA-binding protein